MPKAEAEYCHEQAERMRVLAKQCIDPTIRLQVEGMAKNWTDKAVREDRLALDRFIFA